MSNRLNAKKESKREKNLLESIVLYDERFYYHKPAIQYLDSYKSDFLFIKDFPFVIDMMSTVLDKMDFREMIKCALYSNIKIYNDGELLKVAPETKISVWHSYLLESFLGEDAKNYIIRGDYFNNNFSLIKNSLNNNIALCNNILSRIKSKRDYSMSKDYDLLNWLSLYSRMNAFSYKKIFY
ncbi:MAG: hypothetical protein QXK76_01485 [Candidatus Woesearchaeota archaeon]